MGYFHLHRSFRPAAVVHFDKSAENCLTVVGLSNVGDIVELKSPMINSLAGQSSPERYIRFQLKKEEEHIRQLLHIVAILSKSRDAMMK